MPYSWLDDHTVIIPAIVDFTTGEVRPLAAFADPAVVGRGNLVGGID